jgi:hypothetical protein
MMSDERPEVEEGRVNPYRPSWPPSPRTQIILIAIGFGLLNLVLIIAWGVALYMGR